MTVSALSREFELDTSYQAPGLNLPQKIGTHLWTPMLALALMAFPIALLLGFAKSVAVANDAGEATIAALSQFGPAFMFVGFASVFAAISFAIAHILGVFRVGGGEVQQAAGRAVKTLKMPTTAKVFIGLMVMAMMALVLAVIAHFAIGLAILGGSDNALANSEVWFSWLEGVRRLGTAVYLLAIAFGLASIIEVLRFQAQRIRELPSEPPLPIR